MLNTIVLLINKLILSLIVYWVVMAAMDSDVFVVNQNNNNNNNYNSNNNSNDISEESKKRKTIAKETRKAIRDGCVNSLKACIDKHLYSYYNCNIIELNCLLNN